MRTPSLRNRVVVLGVMVVVVVLASTDAVLYFAFRAQLFRNLDDVLDQRSELVLAEARSHTGEDLSTRLTELGLRAAVRSSDGTVYWAKPPSPVLDKDLPAGGAISMLRSVSRNVPLPDGSVVTVMARRTGADDARRSLLLLEGAGLIIGPCLAALLLLRTSSLALRPLQRVAASARRTSAGQRGERLQPDRLDTSLGELASAYDDMLESLETSSQQANDAQAESERLYLNLRQVVETANAAFIAMDSSGVITDWNGLAERTFGWTRAEVVGRMLTDTIVPPALRGAHTAGLRRFLNNGEHRLLGNTVELDALHRDGHVIPVEVAAWVTNLGDEVTFGAFLRDISERRKGEEAIGRLASIVESAQEAIFSTSLDGTICTWNFGAERTYGFTVDEALGQHVSLIIPPERGEEIEVMRGRIERGESVTRYETVRRRKDGSEVELAVTSSPVFDAWGAVTGASTIARDISEQRRVAKALDKTLQALADALREAQAAEERSSQFLADAAHQLRSPMSGIRACAETLLRGTAEGDRERLLVELVRETSRAGRLTASLLRLARVDQGTTLEPHPCDVVALCEAQVDRVHLFSPALTVTLHLCDEPDRWPEVGQDSLTDILSNLLDNAARHAATTIEVTLRADQGDLHILVADDGPGVAEEARERIFERFVSLDGRGGSGLGLPIARDLARSYGGDLIYDGVAFRLSLPLHSKRREDARIGEDA